MRRKTNEDPPEMLYGLDRKPPKSKMVGETDSAKTIALLASAKREASRLKRHGIQHPELFATKGKAS